MVSNYERGGLGDNLITNRMRTARAGVTVSDIDEILYDWFGQRPLMLIRRPERFFAGHHGGWTGVPAGSFGSLAKSS